MAQTIPQGLQLQFDIEEMLLKFADAQRELSRDDFLLRSQGVAGDIIQEVSKSFAAKIYSILSGRADNLIDALEQLHDEIV